VTRLKGAVTGPIDVMLVDDHAIWREAIRNLLGYTEFRVVGEAGSGREALDVLQTITPRLILLDIRMAGGDGLDTLVAIKALYPTISVVMLTTYDNPTYMARAVAGGAAGYLLKGVDGMELVNALHTVANGEILLTVDDLKRSLGRVAADRSSVGDPIKPLTAREEEVLRLVGTGLNNREIGAILFISEGTVKTHVEHIIQKLGVSDRVQAVVWAARYGLISLDLPESSANERP